MKQSEYITRVLEASEGFTLTQYADVPLLERTLVKKIYLAVNDSPDNWKEITDEEAEEIRRQQEFEQPEP